MDFLTALYAVFIVYGILMGIGMGFGAFIYVIALAVKDERRERYIRGKKWYQR